MAEKTQPTGVTVVMVGDPGPAVKWSWGNLALASFSVFCCPVLGLAAVVMAMLAYVDHKVQDFTRSQHKRKIARNLAIASIVCGCIILLGIIVLFT